MKDRRFTSASLPILENIEELATGNFSPPPEFQDRLLSSLNEEDYLRRTTYGSIQEEAPCCVAGAHFMTSGSHEYARRSLTSSMDSAVHVDISDLVGEGDAPCVPLSLRKCQRTVIAPYSCLLSFIGWRPWFYESSRARSGLRSCFNCLYPAIVVALIMCHYVFQVLNCQGKFNIHRDVEVFLQSHSTRGLQNALIRNSRLFFFAALLWLLCQFVLEILYNFTFPQTRLEFLGMTYKYVFMVIKFIAMGLVQGVNMAVAINYCVQCETLILYIKGICLRLHEKSMELKSAMHEILGVREYISLLNGNVAKMMGLCIVNFTELTILGTALLFLNRIKECTVLSYRVMFPALWIIALLVPLIQAARLTRVGSKLRQISFEMRVFGYQNCSMLELDSFVLFVSGATLRSKIFGVTIRSSTVILTLGLSVFILFTLMVVDILTVTGYERFF